MSEIRRDPELPSDSFTDREICIIWRSLNGPVDNSSFVCRKADGRAYGIKRYYGGQLFFSLKQGEGVVFYNDTLIFCREAGIDPEQFFPKNRYTGVEIETIRGYACDMGKDSFVCRDAEHWAYGRKAYFGRDLFVEVRERVLNILSEADFNEKIRGLKGPEPECGCEFDVLRDLNDGSLPEAALAGLIAWGNGNAAAGNLRQEFIDAVNDGTLRNISYGTMNDGKLCVDFWGGGMVPSLKLVATKSDFSEWQDFELLREYAGMRYI